MTGHCHQVHLQQELPHGQSARMTSLQKESAGTMRTAGQLYGSAPEHISIQRSGQHRDQRDLAGGKGSTEILVSQSMT